MTARRGHRLLQLGVLLFLLGLLTGFTLPVVSNPRMALSSHLEGVLNGVFLVALGLLWPRLRLGAAAEAATFWLAFFGTYVNWATTLLSAAWGAGQRMMPIASGTHHGTAGQEGLIALLLIALSLADVAVCVLVLWGLRHLPDRQGEELHRGGAAPTPA